MIINKTQLGNTNIFSNIISQIQNDINPMPLQIPVTNGSAGGLTIRKYTHGTSIRLKPQAITATVEAAVSTGNVPRWL